MKSSPRSVPDELATDRYQGHSALTSTIGSECFKAFDQVDGKPVFVKMVNSARFRRELNALSVPDHVNLVLPIDACYVNKTKCVLVYPWVSSRTLRSELKSRKTISDIELFQLARQLLNGLGVLHQHGIIHRDIKPENILISGNPGTPKTFLISDFGSSVTIEEARNGRWRGASPAYEAPESVGGRAGFSSDLYSLGVTLYEAATGLLPFTGMPQEIVRKTIHEFPSLAAIRNSRLRLLIVRLLQKHPSARPESPQLALQQLDHDEAAAVPYFPRELVRLVPQLSLRNVRSPNGDYDWVGCDASGEYIAFGKTGRVLVYDFKQRSCGSICWYGAAPVWHGKQLWTLFGSDLYRWDVPSRRQLCIGSLGLMPEVFDVDAAHVAWISSRHLVLAGLSACGLSAPRACSLPGYVEANRVAIAADCVLVACGKHANEIIAYSFDLQLLWTLKVEGIIDNIKVQDRGHVLVLVRNYDKAAAWSLLALNAAQVLIPVPLPMDVKLISLTSVGAVVWTHSGVVTVRPSIDDFKRAEIESA